MNNNILNMFSQMASKYDTVMGSYYYNIWDDTINKLNIKPEANILDLGCGTGEILFKIVNKYKGQPLHLVGVDFSSEMIGQAKRKALEMLENKSSQIYFFCQDFIEYLKNSEGNKYDLVLASFILAYVDSSKLFDLVKEVLKKEGRLIIFNTSKDFFEEFEKILFRFIVMHPFYINWRGLLTKSLSLAPSLEKVIRLLSSFKFRKIEVDKFTINMSFSDPMDCFKWMDESSFATQYINLIKTEKKIEALEKILDYIEKISFRFKGQPVKRGVPLRFDWEIYRIIAEK